MTKYSISCSVSRVPMRATSPTSAAIEKKTHTEMMPMAQLRKRCINVGTDAAYNGSNAV